MEFLVEVTKEAQKKTQEKPESLELGDGKDTQEQEDMTIDKPQQ